MSDAAMIDNTDLMMDKDEETEGEPKDTEETTKKDEQVGETQKDNPDETKDSSVDKEDMDQEL